MGSVHYWQDCFQDIQEHHGLCYHVGFNVSRGLGEGLLAHLQGLCKAATKKALGSAMSVVQNNNVLKKMFYCSTYRCKNVEKVDKVIFSSFGKKMQ